MNQTITAEPHAKEENSAHSLPAEDHTIAPDGVIYRCIDYRENGTGGYELYYTNDYDRPYPVKIKDFLKGKLNYPPAEPGDALFDTADGSRLDLNCIEDCTILLYLNESRNWQFSTNGDAFSTKRDEGGKYGGLKYVNSDGSTTGGKPAAGCRLLYFRAKCKKETFENGFNLKLQLLLRDGTVKEVLIDPDIRNPGGSGYIST